MITLKPGDAKRRALEFTERGWHVFPIVRNGKQPITPNGQDDASNDPATVERLFHPYGLANAGIHCRPSGLYVIDIDMNPWRQKVGRESWADLVAEHGETKTFAVRTWSGGLHLYYAYTDGLLANSSGKLGKDVDTRGNGYVVAPGGVVAEDGHIGTYEIDTDIPLAPLPQWIIDALTPRKSAARSALAGLVVPADTQERVLERMTVLADRLRDAPDGTGNDTASRVAYWAGQYVGAGQIGEQEVIDILMAAVADWAWRSRSDADTMRSTIERQVSAGMASPRAWEKPVATDAIRVAPPAAAADSEPERATGGGEEGAREAAQHDLSDWSTHLGQAHHLKAHLPSRVINADGVGWFMWDGKRWAQVSQARMMNRVGTFYRTQFRSMVEKYKTTEEERYNARAKAYKKFMSIGVLTSILSAFATIDGILVDADALDQHKELLNTPAGVVNLRTGEIGPHDPALMLTKITRGNYRPGFTHADWVKALTGLSPESATYLQLRFGQAATGYTPTDAVFMVGHGKNSKTLLLSDGTVRAIGDYAYLSGPALISTGQDSSAATPDKAGLRGVRLAYIEEMPEAGSLSVAELKRVVETPMVKARFLNQNPFEFAATHSLFVTSNYVPGVNQTDDGTWRRLCQVRFPIKFVEQPEGPNEREADPGLKSRCRAGADGQHDAILTWMVEGARRYFHNEALIEEEQRPADVAEATKSWRMSADRIMAYYAERLVIDPDSAVARSDLYADFTAFLLEQGHAKWSLETFSSRFMGHEQTVKAAVAKIRSRSREGLVRPNLPMGSGPGCLQPLPNQPWVLRGIRFLTD